MGLPEFLGKWGVFLCAVCDGILIGFGMVFVILSIYYKNNIGGSEGPTDAFLFAGIMFFGLGIAGSIGLWLHNWMVLLVVNIATVGMFVLLVAFAILAAIVGYDYKDPVGEGVVERWETIRPEVEKNKLCNEIVGCTEFYKYAADVIKTKNWGDTSQKTKDMCEGKTVADLATDCKLATNCRYDLGTHKIKGCTTCDAACQGAAIDEAQASMEPLSILTFTLFFFLLCVCLFNDFLMERDSFGGAEGALFDGAKDQMEWIGIGVNGFNAFVSFILLCVAGSQAGGDNSAAIYLLLLALCLMGSSAVVAVGIFLQNPLTPILLLAGNAATMGFSLLLLGIGVVAALAAGIVSDLQTRIDDDWDNIRAEMQTANPHYCAYMDDDQCKNKIKDTIEDESKQLVFISIFVLIFLAGKIYLMHRTTKFFFKFSKKEHALM